MWPYWDGPPTLRVGWALLMINQVCNNWHILSSAPPRSGWCSAEGLQWSLLSAYGCPPLMVGEQLIRRTRYPARKDEL